jgi:hypothetical protein
MKKVLCACLVLVATSVLAEAETKKVCVDKKDSKGNVVKKADGTVVQDCKEIKVHKKLEGTKVPDKK